MKPPIKQESTAVKHKKTPPEVMALMMEWPGNDLPFKVEHDGRSYVDGNALERQAKLEILWQRHEELVRMLAELLARYEQLATDYSRLRAVQEQMGLQLEDFDGRLEAVEQGSGSPEWLRPCRN